VFFFSVFPTSWDFTILRDFTHREFKLSRSSL